jgi:hypothetical protein
MKLADLFEELSKKEFQNPDTGNLFFPAYIYTYNPFEEYSLRDEIEEIKNRLIRTDIFQECMVINIYDEFINYLKSEKLEEETLFNLLIEFEKNEGVEEAFKNLKEVADSKEFLRTIDRKIVKHFELPSKYKKVYVLIHGFGSIFPYLRTSEFIKRFEEYVVGGGYKIIAFYPGKFDNNHYYLFNEINSEDLYRAVLLNK